jgi:hypothetical protein
VAIASAAAMKDLHMQSGNHVFEIGHDRRCRANGRNIEGTPSFRKDPDRKDAGQVLPGRVSRVAMRNTIACDVKHRSDRESCEPRAGKHPGCGPGSYVESHDHPHLVADPRPLTRIQALSRRKVGVAWDWVG